MSFLTMALHVTAFTVEGIYIKTLKHSSFPGEILPVGGSPFDFRRPTRLGDVIPLLNATGYDNNFCLRGPTGVRLAARYKTKH